MKKEKIFMIISISIFILCLMGSTYALYKRTLSSSDFGINTNTPGLDKYIIYEKGEDINGTLNTSATYIGGKNSSIKFYKKDNTYDIYGEIVLTINSIGTNLSNSSALKYVLVNNGNILSEGSLNGVSAGSKITIINNLFLEDTEQIYTIYVWLDINEELGNISGETLDISVDCSANMVPETFATYITKLYDNTTKTVITNNSIEYNYATSVSLMNDRLGGTTSDYDGGNIRYYGANPNNYVYFNCSDYSNQTSDTCELWRIIGVFNGKVKLIRNEAIGTYAYDNKLSGVGTSTSDYGSNDWSDSRLMIMLNPIDYSSSFSTDIYAYDKGSYWYGLSSTCYEGSSSGTKACDFTSIGLKNDTTRNLISEETYYLRGNTSSSVYSDEMYNYERTTGSVYNSSRPTNWNGKIALAYSSDYGYAADFNYCTQNLFNYNNSTCKSNNWIKNIFGASGKHAWLLSPSSNYSYVAWITSSKYASSSGYAYAAYQTVAADVEVAPVLHLNSNIGLASNTGNGTSTNPYRLSV